MSLIEYGWVPSMAEEGMPGIPARVTAAHRGRYEVVCDLGEGYAKLKSSVYHNGEELFPTTGDFVMIDWQQSGDSRILRTLERRTFFSRRDPSSAGHWDQAVAANFDYVFLIQSLNHDFNPKRLERYLTLAWQSGAVPVVVLTKSDLVEDCTQQIEAARQIAIGAEVFAVSAINGSGFDALAGYLSPGKTIVFLGSSGVGKSTLVNALAGQETMEVGEIREDDSRGRHTTTHRQLIKLPSGVMVIDTPGMRELGMWDVTEGIGQSFADVEQFLGHCRFSDCRHQSEPGCAVKAAIERGELSPERWERYLKLKSEAKFSDDKTEYLRQKQQWHKSISKLNKTNKKRGIY